MLYGDAPCNGIKGYNRNATTKELHGQNERWHLLIHLSEPFSTRSSDRAQIWHACADRDETGSHQKKLTHPTPGGLGVIYFVAMMFVGCLFVCGCKSGAGFQKDHREKIQLVRACGEERWRTHAEESVEGGYTREEEEGTTENKMEIRMSTRFEKYWTERRTGRCGEERSSVIPASLYDGKSQRKSNCTISCYCVQAVRTESRYKRQFGSNSLLFTTFKTF